MATLHDYRDREHWSFSALNQFLNICSLQFAFDRVYKLERAFTPLSLSFGSAFHRALEWLHLVRKDGGMPREQEARDLFCVRPGTCFPACRVGAASVCGLRRYAAPLVDEGYTGRCLSRVVRELDADILSVSFSSPAPDGDGEQRRT